MWIGSWFFLYVYLFPEFSRLTYFHTKETINQNQPNEEDYTLFLATGLFVAGIGFIFTSCTKEGPQGAPGLTEKMGRRTFSYNPARSVTISPTTIVAKIFQYNASRHATGSTLLEASNNHCAPCHSSQGFRRGSCHRCFQDCSRDYRCSSDQLPVPATRFIKRTRMLTGRWQQRLHSVCVMIPR